MKYQIIIKSISDKPVNNILVADMVKGILQSIGMTVRVIEITEVTKSEILTVKSKAKV